VTDNGVGRVSSEVRPTAFAAATMELVP
jgi:hypothetical protein